MYLVEQHVFKKKTREYDLLDEVCRMTKNLYNAGLYIVRQKYFKDADYINYYKMSKLVKEIELPEFRALPAGLAECTLILLDKNFQSFFALLKKKQKGGEDGYNKKIRIPRYLDKDKGRFIATYPLGSISKKELETNGVIKLTRLDMTIKTNVKYEQVKQVRVVPRHSFYVVEVLYRIPDVEPLPDNGRYASIDLGVNNLATIAFNCERPIIINGKPIKSVNQYFNKRKGDLQSKLTGNKRTSNLIHAVTRNRNNTIKNYLHKASRYIVDYLLKNNINTLFIGKNDGWKQEVDIGKTNNQNFVQIPHTQLVEMLHYKCGLAGITVFDVPEAYTSKCSFFDDEPIKKKTDDKYVGKRIKRGLFRTSKGWIVNADCNGALNIMRRGFEKHFQDGTITYESEKLSMTPKIITISDDTVCKLMGDKKEDEKEEVEVKEVLPPVKEPEAINFDNYIQAEFNLLS